MVRCQGWWTFALLAASLVGCQTEAPFNFSELIPTPAPIGPEPNPFYVPIGGQYAPEQYARVFENCLDVLLTYGFEIAESNRYDGRIETVPRSAPGCFQFYKPSSPDCYNRFLYTLQPYRHRVSIRILPADQGGFFLEVIARKELEDLPRPIRALVGGAIFRTDNDVDRQFEVIDPTFFQPGWIYKGRDVPLEQELIDRLKCLM